MDTGTMIFRYGFTEEETEAIKETARIWAERVRIAVEEAVAAFARILSVVGSSGFEKMEDLRKELEEIGKEPRARRRKLERDRARIIEQRYRAEIRRVERARIYRPVYKPSKSRNRRNKHETGKGDCDFAVL